MAVYRPIRIDVTCTACGRPKTPVVGVMVNEGYTAATYVCRSCRVRAKAIGAVLASPTQQAAH